MDAAAMMRQCLSIDEIEDYAYWMINERTLAERTAQLKKALSQAKCDSTACAYMILSLIRMQMHLPRHDKRVNNRTWTEALSLWENTIIFLPPQIRYSLEIQVIHLAHQKLFNDLNKLDYKVIKNIAELLPYVVIPTAINKVVLDYSAVANFTKRLFTFPHDNTFGRLEYHALRCDIITGSLNCPYSNENDMMSDIEEESSRNIIKELKKDDLVVNAYKCNFKIMYLKEIFFRRIECKEKDDGQDLREAEIMCNDFLENTFFQDEFIELLRSYTVMNTLQERYAFHSDYNIIQQMTQQLLQFIEDVIEATNKTLRQQILGLLSQKSQNIGFYWAFAKRFYETKIPIDDDFEDSESDTSDYRGILSKCESTSTIYLSDSVESLDYDSFSEESEDESDVEHDEVDEVVSVKCFHNLQAKLKWGQNEEALRILFYAALRSFQVAHRKDPDVVNEEFLHDATMCRLECTPDVLVNAYRRHKHIIIAQRDLVTVSWAQVVSNAAIADYLSEVVASRFWGLTFDHWDLIDKTLNSLMGSLEVSVVDHWGCIKVAIISRATFSLLTEVQLKSANVPDEFQESIGMTRLIDGIVPEVTKRSSRIVLAILKNEHSHLSVSHMATLAALIKSLPFLALDRMPSVQGSVYPPAEKLANEAFNALRGYRHPSVKLLAFMLLKKLSHSFVIADTVKLLEWSGQTEYIHNNQIVEVKAEVAPPLSLVAFEEPLTYLQRNVDNALSEVRLCEKTYKLVPFSFHHSPILGYMMVSILLYEQTEKARGDLIQHYVDYISRHNYAEYWMKNCLRLLPEEILEYIIDETGSVDRPTKYSEYFPKTAAISVEAACQPLTVSALVCRCLVGALGGVGLAGARAWWSRTSRKQAAAVKKLVANFISVPLRERQFKDVAIRIHMLPWVSINTNSGISEASCIINVWDGIIELCVRYSCTHPLVPPHVYSPSSPFAPRTTWLTPYFDQQHGNLFNAFDMWIYAVRARAECRGMYKCFICYCTRHLTSGTLPSMFCPRCFNQYHQQCVVNNQCPICH